MFCSYFREFSFHHHFAHFSTPRKIFLAITATWKNWEALRPVACFHIITRLRLCLRRVDTTNGRSRNLEFVAFMLCVAPVGIAEPYERWKATNCRPISNACTRAVLFIHQTGVVRGMKVMWRRHSFSDKVFASELRGWVFDPGPLSESPATERIPVTLLGQEAGSGLRQIAVTQKLTIKKKRTCMRMTPNLTLMRAGCTERSTSETCWPSANFPVRNFVSATSSLLSSPKSASTPGGAACRCL